MATRELPRMVDDNRALRFPCLTYHARIMKCSYLDRLSQQKPETVRVHGDRVIDYRPMERSPGP